MKKLLLTSMMILLTASSSMSARITLDEAVDATLDGNVADATGKDWRLTDFSNFADLNTMLTEIYGWSWYTQDQIDAMVLSKTNTDPYTPTANYHPATKLYADSLVLPLASQAQMEAGTETDVLAMSPLRVKQAIDALATGVTDAELIDIAGITFAQGDILTYDGLSVVKIGPGTPGQYLKTGGVGADVSWGDPAGSGDVTAVGDSESGAAFTPDGTGNVLYFEGTTANGFEIALTGANPGADVIVTIPAATDTLVGKTTTDVLTNKDLTSGTNTFPTFNQDTTGNAATATLATNAANATNATTATTATTANAGDSATLFFTTGTIEAARLPDLSGTYEPADAAIVKSDETETISADWINTANPWAVNEGGTGVATLNDAGLLVGNGTSGIEALADGLTTQVLIGGGADTNPTWSTDLPGGTTLGSQYIYRIGGTDVADADVTNNLTINAQDGSTWNVVDSVTTTSVYNGSTSLEESTSATDSGAYIIGVYDDFTNATATNVQGVLKQFDTAISGGGSTLGDVLTTPPLLINGGANLNDILPGVDADVTISIPAATISANGYLTATDWNTFNGKQDALTSPIVAAGAQSITGVKTFTVSPIVPTPTTDYQAAPKNYVDGLIPETTTFSALAAGLVVDNSATSWLSTLGAAATSCFADATAFASCFPDLTIGGGIDSVLTGYTSGAGTVAATDTILEAIQKLNGNVAGVSAGAFTLDTYPTYEDSAHTTGFAVNGTSLAVYSSTAGKWLTVGLTDSLDPAPTTYTLSGTITDTPGTGSTFTIAGTAYDATDSPIEISGLSSATQSISFAANTNELGNCTGTGLTGTADTGPWAVDMSTGDVTDLACTVGAAPATSVIDEDFSGLALPTGWSVTTGTVDFSGGTASIAASSLLQSPTFTAMPEVWVTYRVTITGASATSIDFFTLNAGATTAASTAMRYNPRFGVYVQGVVEAYGLDVAKDVSWYVCTRYVAGTGTDAIATTWHSADGTTWTQDATITTGSATASITNFKIQNSGTTDVLVLDDILLSATDPR